MKIENNILLEVTNEDIVDGQLIIPEGVKLIDAYFDGLEINELRLPTTLTYFDLYSKTNIEIKKIYLYKYTEVAITSFFNIKNDFSVVIYGAWTHRGKLDEKIYNLTNQQSWLSTFIYSNKFTQDGIDVYEGTFFNNFNPIVLFKSKKIFLCKKNGYAAYDENLYVAMAEVKIMNKKK